jgi:hypothetical protein
LPAILVASSHRPWLARSYRKSHTLAVRLSAILLIVLASAARAETFPSGGRLWLVLDRKRS